MDRRRSKPRAGLTVKGETYTNSAAKFWPRLVRDVQSAFPACTAVELSATMEGPLDTSHLHPQLALQRALDRLAAVNAREALAQTVQELEMFGPPAAVAVRLLAGNEELRHELQFDEVDAEILPCLAVWLLEWAAIPRGRWNGEVVHGEFTAADGLVRTPRPWVFSVENRHLSEGLHRLTVTLHLP